MKIISVIVNVLTIVVAALFYSTMVDKFGMISATGVAVIGMLAYFGARWVVSLFTAEYEEEDEK